MSGNDFHAELDHLARKVEEKIAEGEAKIEEIPDFEPRSERSKQIRRVTRVDESVGR